MAVLLSGCSELDCSGRQVRFYALRSHAEQCQQDSDCRVEKHVHAALRTYYADMLADCGRLR